MRGDGESRSRVDPRCVLDGVGAVVDPDHASSRADQLDGLEPLAAPEVEQPAVTEVLGHGPVAGVVEG